MRYDRSVRWWLLIALSGCGRFDFDPIGQPGLGGDSGVPHGDGSSSSTSDSGMPLTDGAPMPDAFPAECANAFALTTGQKLTISTCASGDHLDGCGPANTQEVMLKFTAPASAGYTFEAFDHGTQNVSNSTSRVTNACGLQSGCTAVLGFQVNAGQTVYLMVEASGGGCAMIDYSVM